jgi:hypothetical protein
MRDPIDLLTPPTAGPDPEQRGRVLAATLGELRRRRRGRRERLVGALAAAVAAAVVLFAVAPPLPRTERLGQPIEHSAVEPRPADVEWTALDHPEQAKQLYREAGRRYVEEGDFAGAVRSYGGALDAGTADDLEATAEDDWLLAAIKIARRKESEP